MKFGTIVYHVANPTVKGVVIDPDWMEHQHSVKVHFETAVKFTGNPTRYHREWDCSKHLLCATSDEAAAKHDPNLNPAPKSLSDILVETLKKVTYDQTRIKLQPIHVLGVLGHPEITPDQANCEHDWVTWTGLRGTQTDCSKCKMVRK